MIEATVIVLLLLILAALCFCAHLLQLIERSTRDTSTEVRDLRLTSRARMRRAKVSTGVPEVEDGLVRVGRVAQPRRVVFGGDGDSTLNRALEGLPELEDDEAVNG